MNALNALACFVGVLLLSLGAAHESSAAVSAQSSPPVPAQCLKLVHEYVKQTRGWDTTAYVVAGESVGGPGRGFSVWLLAELKPVRPPGSSASFHVDTDRECSRVVRELAYQ